MLVPGREMTLNGISGNIYIGENVLFDVQSQSLPGVRSNMLVLSIFGLVLTESVSLPDEFQAK